MTFKRIPRLLIYGPVQYPNTLLYLERKPQRYQFWYALDPLGFVILSFCIRMAKNTKLRFPSYGTAVCVTRWSQDWEQWIYQFPHIYKIKDERSAKSTHKRNWIRILTEMQTNTMKYSHALCSVYCGRVLRIEHEKVCLAFHLHFEPSPAASPIRQEVSIGVCYDSA